MKENAYLSLRSTGDRPSNLNSGSFRMDFQFPTPHCVMDEQQWLSKGPVRAQESRARTLLHPATSICVSSIVHFFLGFFSGLSVGRNGSEPWPPVLEPDAPSTGIALPSSAVILRILPLFSPSTSSVLSPECTPRPVSSRKLQAGKTRGEDGRASETRRCFAAAACDDGDGG